MPVTEIATIKLVAPHTPSSPDFLSFYATLRAAQTAGSGYPVSVFQDIHDADTLYLIGGWESVANHWAWLAEDKVKPLLAQTSGLLEVAAIQHVATDNRRLVHARVLVWTQWMGEEAKELLGSGLDSLAGVIVDEGARAVASFKAFGFESEARDVVVQEGEAVFRMRRLPL